MLSVSNRSWFVVVIKQGFLPRTHAVPTKGLHAVQVVPRVEQRSRQAQQAGEHEGAAAAAHGAGEAHAGAVQLVGHESEHVCAELSNACYQSEIHSFARLLIQPTSPNHRRQSLIRKE